MKLGKASKVYDSVERDITTIKIAFRALRKVMRSLGDSCEKEFLINKISYLHLWYDEDEDKAFCTDWSKLTQNPFEYLRKGKDISAASQFKMVFVRQCYDHSYLTDWLDLLWLFADVLRKAQGDKEKASEHYIKQRIAQGGVRDTVKWMKETKFTGYTDVDDFIRRTEQSDYYTSEEEVRAFLLKKLETWDEDELRFPILHENPKGFTKLW